MRTLFYLFIFALLFGCSNKEEKKLLIATAANVQFAMKELIREFEYDTGIKCEMVLGSSGQLITQIKSNAPYDIFVSANMKYPNDLFENHLTLEKPKLYAKGILVLWSKNSGSKFTLGTLLSDSIKKIAIANPSIAPYGEAAVEVLKKMNFLEALNSKLIYGESISQVNQFIKSESVDAGFTSKSSVLSPELKDTGLWVEIDQSYYTPIEQGIVMIKGKHEEQARQFYDFMLSEKGKNILSANGYGI
jgi:molybdate transport system substrate-binding protein